MSSCRATQRQWHDLISQLGAILDLLAKHGPEAFLRAASSVGGIDDGYPSRSMPESSIAGGRMGDPTGTTVVRHAGGNCRECKGRGFFFALALTKLPCRRCGGSGCAPDTWQTPTDPIGAAVEKMQLEVADALARLATALLAAGEQHEFALPQETDTWSWRMARLDWAIRCLGAIPVAGSGLGKTESKRLERECLDALNRLRGAQRAMNEALPRQIPDPPREVCTHCGMSKWIATEHGEKPKRWRTARAACSSCCDRIDRARSAT